MTLDARVINELVLQANAVPIARFRADGEAFQRYGERYGVDLSAEVRMVIELVCEPDAAERITRHILAREGEPPLEEEIRHAHDAVMAAAEGSDDEAYRAALEQLRELEKDSLRQLLAARPPRVQTSLEEAKQVSKEIDELLRRTDPAADSGTG